MKIKSIFKRHTAEMRYPVVSTDTWGSRIKCGMTAAILVSFIIMPAFATDPDPEAATTSAQKTVASKAYVDTKQDKITTGLVNYYSLMDLDTIQVPSLVSYDSTNGLVGNKIGILGSSNTRNIWESLTSSEMDNFVPTVRAVAESLSDLYSSKQNNLPAAWTSTTAIYAMASTGGQTIELGGPVGVSIGVISPRVGRNHLHKNPGRIM